MATLEELVDSGDCFTQVSLCQLREKTDGSLFLFIRFSRAQARDRLWPTPRTSLGTTKTNMWVLENHAT